MTKWLPVRQHPGGEDHHMSWSAVLMELRKRGLTVVDKRESFDLDGRCALIW
jgi:hypothetical protein